MAYLLANDHDDPLPRRMRVLGNALQPVLQELQAQLAQPQPCAGLFVGHDLHIQVVCLMEQLEQSGKQLEAHINALMANVLGAPHASDAEVYRAAGKVEAAIQSLLQGHAQACALSQRADALYPARLLTSVYAHLLTHVERWLKQLLSIIHDPLSAVRARGLPESGHVQLECMLVCPPAPESRELARWIQLRTHSPSGGSLLNTLGVAFLGWKIGDALFGKDKNHSGS